MSADLDAIKRRWATDHDRGAHDYTDAGCRVLAEHGFEDVAWLATRAERLEAALARLSGSVSALMDNPESVVAQQFVIDAWDAANEVLGGAAGGGGQ